MEQKKSPMIARLSNIEYKQEGIIYKAKRPMYSYFWLTSFIYTAYD